MLRLIAAIVYGVFASIRWKTVGETNVVIAWMLFFLAGGLTVLLIGLDTMILEAGLPFPLGGSRSRVTTGGRAVASGRALVVAGVITPILGGVGILAASAGIYTPENWIQTAAGMGVLAGLQGIVDSLVRRARRARRT